jgi:hypothetical protein
MKITDSRMLSKRACHFRISSVSGSSRNMWQSLNSIGQLDLADDLRRQRTQRHVAGGLAR